MFSTIIVGVQLLILHVLLSVYHASIEVSKDKRLEVFIQSGMVALILCNYTKFYSISIFHPDLIIRTDYVILVSIVIMCVILQLSLLHLRKTRLAWYMLLLTLVNVGAISSLSM